MTGGKAIETLDEMLRMLNAARARLADEACEVQEQWARLGAIGGQRDDHAALLLGRLSPHLREIDRLVNDFENRIAVIQADPFGRKGG